MTLRRGLDYVISAAMSIPSIGLLLVVSPWALRGHRRGTGLQVVAIIAGTFAYAMLVGGDFMAMGRLLVPAMPFLAVLSALVVERVASSVRAGPAWAWATAALLVLLSLLPAFNLHPVPRAVRAALDFRGNLPGYATEYERWRGMRGNTARWSLLGKALARHTRPGDSLVFDGIGAVGYYSGLFIYDQYGLVDREAAGREAGSERRSPGHDRFVEPEFFLGLEPTYLGAYLSFGGEAREPERAPPPPYRAETIPLDPAAGFPEGTSLTLIRRDRSRDEPLTR